MHLEYSLAAGRDEPPEKTTLQEAVGEGQERAGLQPRMCGEEMSGEDKGVEPRAKLLPRPLPEAPAPPVLKALPVVIKKIKMQQVRALQG